MPEPSDSEFEVLKLFWRAGPMSAREVQTLAEPELGWADSTTRTVLERMCKKGLLARRSVHGMAVYEPAREKVEVLGGVLRKLRGVFEMAGPLSASAFTGSQILNAAELDELQSILDADSTTRDEGKQP
jgi:predicted transcriptional regulator